MWGRCARKAEAQRHFCERRVVLSVALGLGEATVVDDPFLPPSPLSEHPVAGTMITAAMIKNMAKRLGICVTFRIARRIEGAAAGR